MERRQDLRSRALLRAMVICTAVANNGEHNIPRQVIRSEAAFVVGMTVSNSEDS
jgi:hypothetical protein